MKWATASDSGTPLARFSEQTQTDYLRRLSVTLPESLIIDVEERILRLRKAGSRISFSGLVEIALRELMNTSDLKSVLVRHGASARRRHLVGNGPTANR